MPALSLTSRLLQALPWLSPRGRAVVNFLVCNNGRAPSANVLATRLGLRSRHQLARLLRREGLPRYDVLTGWVSLLFWRVEADRTHETLYDLAGRSSIAPATSYRLVRRISGKPWRSLVQGTTDDIVQRFVELCGHPHPNHRCSTPAPTSAVRVQAPSRVVPARAIRLPLHIAMSGAPCAIARLDPTEIYVARAHAAALERLDARTGRITGSIPVGCVPSCIAIDSQRARAYVSLQFEDAIAVLDLASQTITRRFSVAGDPFPLQLSHNGRVLYTATNADRLHALALPTGRIMATLALPATSHFLALHPAGHRLYVAARESGTVLEVDTERLQVTRTFLLHGVCQEMAVTADGRFLYVANEGHGLDVVRLADGHAARAAQLQGRAVHLTLSTDERTVYVALYEAGAVAAVDRYSGDVQFMPTGGRPRGLAATFNGAMLAVSNEAGWVDFLPTSVRARMTFSAGTLVTGRPAM